MPIGFEQGAPDGRGRFQAFEHGMSYWTPQTGAHAVSGAILDEWGKRGFERSALGYPETDESKLPNKAGAQQGFEIGSIWYGPETGTHAVQGLILAKYGQMGYEDSWLGFPKSSENAIKDFGKFNDFEGGAIYWSPLSGAYALRNGAILNAWRAAGAENGKLGYPTSDEFDIPGGTQQNFQLGHITVKGEAVEIS
jgi:uncharacterized protein with LGFP repeats